jgi:outer membrane protein assembly factor BamB
MKSFASICRRFVGCLVLVALVSCDSREVIQAQVPADAGTRSPAGRTEDASLASIPLVRGNDSWPRLLGSQFDGVADVKGIEFDWSRTPEVAWRLPVGDGYGLGCVADGRYYHFDAARIERQTVERLRAFDLKDARLIWSVDRPLNYSDLYGYESGPRGTPAIAGESIVTYGVDGGLLCRNVADGSLKWSVATNDEYGVVQNFFGVGSSPLVLDSLVIVLVGGSPPEDQNIAPGRLDRVIPNGSALVAFDLETGTEVWRCGDDLASYSSPRPMQIGSKTVVLAFAREHLLVVDPSTGKVLWKKRHRSDKVESVNAMMPVVSGDRVFISECYQIGSLLMSVSIDGPKTLWQDPPKNPRVRAMECHWSTPILIDGFLYGCSGRNNPDSDFRCIEFESGKVKWSDDRRIRTSVARAGDHLVVLEERGRMQIVRPNAEKLDVVAEYDFGEYLSQPCWAAPIIVGNRMLIRGDRHVLCLAIPIK